MIDARPLLARVKESCFPHRCDLKIVAPRDRDWRCIQNVWLERSPAAPAVVTSPVKAAAVPAAAAPEPVASTTPAAPATPAAAVVSEAPLAPAVAAASASVAPATPPAAPSAPPMDAVGRGED